MLKQTSLIVLLISLILLFLLFGCTVEQDICGNLVCEIDSENEQNCPIDCELKHSYQDRQEIDLNGFQELAEKFLAKYDGNSLLILDKKTGRKIAKINNAKVDYTRFNPTEYLFNGGEDEDGYTLIRDLDLFEGETKTLYVQKTNPNSSSICFTDEEGLWTKKDIGKTCAKIDCPGEIGHYKCEISQGYFEISGLKHSGAVEVNPDCTQASNYGDQRVCVSENNTAPRLVNQPLVVLIKRPLNNTEYPVQATVRISAMATDPDGIITKVEFYKNNTELIYTDVTPPYTTVLEGLPVGTYVITAKAYDNQNATTTSKPVIFHVTNATSFSPTNQNVLCVYNSNVAMSKGICDYYLKKRPGAYSLGLNVPDDAFPSWERFKKEGMSGDKFLSYVVRPTYAYLDSHPEMKITHIAIAKGLPITVFDTAKKLPFGNNLACMFKEGGCTPDDAKLIINSAAYLLAYEGDWRNANTVEDYLFDEDYVVFESNEKNAVVPKPKQDMMLYNSLYREENTVKHFNPFIYTREDYVINPRFAVSHLTGFDIDDITKMIDKAQQPAPNVLQSFFAFPVKDESIADFEWPMGSVGITRDSLVGASNSSNPVSFRKPLVAYSSWGVHQGYRHDWIAGNPMVRSEVANRAVFNSIESWNAATMMGSPNDPERSTRQGLIADAISKNAFGGSNYSNSFSAAFGNVYEPSIAGIVSVVKFYSNYAGGLTIGESFLKSFNHGYYSFNTIIGDPLMRITDAPLVERTIQYIHPGCLTPDSSKIDKGAWICSDNFHKKQCLSNKSELGNEVTCLEGCFQGHCKEEYNFSYPKLILKGNSQKYAISIPVLVEGKTIPEIFQGVKEDIAFQIYDSENSTWGPNIYYDFEWSGNVKKKINSGDGILVWAQSDQEIELAGASLTESPKINLRSGFNFVGLPFCGEKYTASQVLLELSNLGANCNLIYNSNLTVKSWPALFWSKNTSENFQGQKADFRLNNYEAYWIKCGENTNIAWTPSCSPPSPNKAPTTSITRPSNNQNFVAPAMVEISAMATDPDGTITKVEFYANETLLGTDTTSPYNYLWTNPRQGVYTLKTRAYDNLNEASDSNVVNVVILPANQRPLVSITNPIASSVFHVPANIIITTTATDPDGTITKVEFYDGDTLLAERVNPPYLYYYSNVVPGIHEIKIKAYDNQNAVAVAGPVLVHVNRLPVVSVTSPLNNAWYPARATVRISAMATDPDGIITKVEFYKNNTELIYTDVTPPYTTVLENQPIGTYVITAKAYDNHNAVVVSRPVNINVGATNQPPLILITSPLDGANVKMPVDLNILTSVSDSDGVVSGVEFFVNSQKIGEKTSPPFNYTWRPDRVGTYQIFARATDNNRASTNSQTITVNFYSNAPPQVSITRPAFDAEFNEPAFFEIVATATDPDGTITKVEFYGNDQKISEFTSPPYALPITNLTEGTHYFKAIATDNEGSQAVSTQIRVLVNGNQRIPQNLSPNVLIIKPTEGQQFSEKETIIVMVDATDEDGVIKKVEILLDNLKIAELVSSPYLIDLKNLTKGTHTLSVNAIDNKDAYSTTTVNFTIVETTPPQERKLTSVTSITPQKDDNNKISGLRVKLINETNAQQDLKLKIQIKNAQGEIDFNQTEDINLIRTNGETTLLFADSWNPKAAGEYEITVDLYSPSGLEKIGSYNKKIKITENDLRRIIVTTIANNPIVLAFIAGLIIAVIILIITSIDWIKKAMNEEQ
mgnify:CR=1 FL=1